jgi:hypothetical protein
MEGLREKEFIRKPIILALKREKAQDFWTSINHSDLAFTKVIGRSFLSDYNLVLTLLETNSVSL